jgi:hypothetical protein
MKVKGVCPECLELVSCAELVPLDGSVATELNSAPQSSLYLCGKHPTKPGHRSLSVIDQTTGNLVATYCNGSLRPPEDIFTVH